MLRLVDLLSTRWRASLLAVIWVASVAGSGCLPPDVVRVVDGQPTAGRFVSPAAYAAYARGALAEADGEDGQAMRAYLEAVEHDDASVELWTRIGALRCRLGPTEDSAPAFARAEELDPHYEPLWRERARCAERGGRLTIARDAAWRAARLDPERTATALLYASLLERSGDPEQAGRWYRAAVARWPHSLSTWRALAGFAERRGDAAWLREARRKLAALRRVRADRAASPTAGPPAAADGWAEVDEALGRRDLAEARRRARQAHLSDRWLSPRAIYLGLPDLATEQAGRVLAADPSDTDSRIASALAADLQGEAQRLSELLDLPIDAEPPSAISRWLLAELLLRHVGNDAARLWIGQLETASGSSAADPRVDEPCGRSLRHSWRQRFLRRLAGPEVSAPERKPPTRSGEPPTRR